MTKLKTKDPIWIDGKGLSLNVGVGPHNAVKPWVNIDIHRDEAAGITPDIIADLSDLPCDDGSVIRLYAGHLLEHIPIRPYWDENGDAHTSPFDEAMVEVARVLDSKKGHACFVGPDVYKAIQWYRDGRCEWELVDACLEGPDAGISPDNAWDGCFHAFNAHEARVLALVQRTFPGAIAVPMESSFLAEFPLVSRVGWQWAILSKRP